MSVSDEEINAMYDEQLKIMVEAMEKVKQLALDLHNKHCTASNKELCDKKYTRIVVPEVFQAISLDALRKVVPDLQVIAASVRKVK